MTTVRIAVIVLNWNGRDDTLQCLDSLAAVDYDNFEVLVVDNGSSDGSVAAIRAEFPHVAVIETGENLGYAGGNNVGIRVALARDAELMLLLNNDTVVDPRFLSELAAAAGDAPTAGVFGAKIFHYAEQERVWYAGARWDSNKLGFQILKEDPDGDNSVFDTAYACGCALMVRRAVIDRIGYLEPKFFLTYEETDFCYRARRNGFRVVYVPRAVVWHKISASFGGQQSPLVSYFMTRNYLLWTERNLSRDEARAARRHVLRMFKWSVVPSMKGAGGVSGFMHELRARLKNPANQATLWGIVHYVGRRFGPAPRRVLQLGKSR